MTNQVKVGLNSAGMIDRFHAQSFDFSILSLNSGTISGLLVEAPEKCGVDYPIPIIDKDRYPFLINNPSKTVPICLLTNTHSQLIKEPDFLNSLSFPPSLLLGAGEISCSQHFNVTTRVD